MKKTVKKEWYISSLYLSTEINARDPRKKKKKKTKLKGLGANCPHDFAFHKQLVRLCVLVLCLYYDE